MTLRHLRSKTMSAILLLVLVMISEPAIAEIPEPPDPPAIAELPEIPALLL